MSQRTAPTPRTVRGVGPVVRPDGSWLEPEALATPSGFTRRARARVGRSATYRLAWCGVAEPYGAIPARLRIEGRTVKGSVFVTDQSIVFHETAFQGD